MIPKPKTIEFTFKRTIPASPPEVFDVWLDPKSPANPWHKMDKLIFDPSVDGLFYRMHVTDGQELPHYGRFTVLDRPGKIQHTWMSRHTSGLESVVTLTFEAQGEDTLLTLHHANIPDDDLGRMHERGWEHYLGLLVDCFPHTRRERARH
jgi:uncharacterized protein YndB with AHSA1/START domain